MHKRGKGIILSYLKVSINMISGLVLSSVLLRILGDTEYGIYQTVAAFANQLILLEFGVGTVMTRNISLCRGAKASEEEVQRNISTIWTMTCGFSLLVIVASAIFCSMLPSIYAQTMNSEEVRHGQHIYLLVTGQVFFTFLGHSINAIILAYENYTFNALQNTVRTAIRTVLLVVLVVFWENAIAIAAIDMLLGASCVIASWLYCRNRLHIKLGVGKCDFGIVRASLALTFAIFLQAIVGQANNNVDKFVIGVTMSPESVSLYSVALYIFSAFSSLINVPASMYAPSITQKVAQGAKGGQLARQLEFPCRLTAFTGGLILFGVVAVGRQFVEIMYGEQYLIAWPIAIVLMIPAYLDNVIGSLVYVLDAMNKRLARSVVLIATTVMNVILTIVWIPRWGIVGAAVATSLCTLMGPVLAMGGYYKKKLEIPVLGLYFRSFHGVLPCLTLGAAVGFFVGKLFVNNVISLAIGGCIYVTIAVGGCYTFGLNREEKHAICDYIKRKIHKA